MGTIPFAIKLSSHFNPSLLMQEAGRIDPFFHHVQSDYPPAHPRRVSGSIGVFTVSCEGRKPLLYTKTESKASSLTAIQRLLKDLRSPIYTARFMKIHSRSSILPHVDVNLSFEYGIVRLVIPIQYGNKCNFQLRGKRLPMRSGELWWVDVRQPHLLSAEQEEAGLILVIDVGMTPELIAFFPKRWHSYLFKTATFENQKSDFFDPELIGEYAIPFRTAFLFGDSKSSSKSLKIFSPNQKKTCLQTQGGKKLRLFRDEKGDMRVQGEGPGLLLKKIGTRLRLERRGLLYHQGKKPVSCFTLSFTLDRMTYHARSLSEKTASNL